MSVTSRGFSTWRLCLKSTARVRRLSVKADGYRGQRGYSLLSEPYQQSHQKLQQPGETRNFIDNEFRKSQAHVWADLKDPATGHLVTRVPLSTDDELEAAVESAQRAFETWKDLGILRRQQIMFRFVSLIREHWDRLAANITLEQGKTLADARGDVLRGLQVAETACGITTQLTGEVLEVSQDMETRSYREPLGVVAAICPFSKSHEPARFEIFPKANLCCADFPAMIPLWCIPIATITGNTIVVKPSERDPGAAMILAEIAKEAGFPDGVINIIHGTKRAVDFIIREPRIKAISFVGGTATGEYIFAEGSAQGKRVQANLGAKNHAIIMPDSNRNQALNAVLGAAFGAAGQRCMALSTLVTLPETRSWIPELVSRARGLKAGPGFDPDSDLGPVISPESKARIKGLIASAEEEGAQILLDGRDFSPEGYVDGNWVSFDALYHLQSPGSRLTNSNRLDLPSSQESSLT